MVYESDQTGKKPLANSKLVRFNGIREDGHETFYFDRVQEVADYLDDKTMAFGFCKTAQKPYDCYVTACLIWAKMVFGSDVRISSDGEIADWQAGKEIVEKALGLNELVITENDGSFSVKTKMEGYKSDGSESSFEPRKEIPVKF